MKNPRILIEVVLLATGSVQLLSDMRVINSFRKIIRFTVLISIFINLFVVKVHAQNWFPEDATWIFNKQEFFTYPAHGYIRYKVDKDTLLGEIYAKLIRTETVDISGEISQMDTLLAYEVDSKVYYWSNDQFNLMYDFSLNAGDTLNIEMKHNNCDSISPILIDSVSITNIDGQDLEVQHLSYTIYSEELGYNENISESIIEKIGSEEGFIFQPGCYAGEEYTYSGLRCYNDNSISYKNNWWENHFPGYECEALINDSTSSSQNSVPIGYRIFPNPCGNNLNITNGSGDIFYIDIYNSLGKQLRHISASESASIRLEGFQSGIYFLRLYQEQHDYNLFKIIKN